MADYYPEWNDSPRERCFDKSNHATTVNMDCSPTKHWAGSDSCRRCDCGRFGQHVTGCKREST